MKLWKQSARGFEYQLDEEETGALRFLIGQFPLGPFSRVMMSKSDERAAEREQLLNESLAEHRKELKQTVEGLVGDGKFKESGRHRLFRVKADEREIMLQVLNDLRIESWRILGEPENLEIDVLSLPKEKIKYYRWMHLAGYFEHHFLNLDGTESS